MRHLKIYRAIRLIQRHGSVRKAAETLAVSPSALNRSIQAFEEELAVSVFDRIPGGVRLSVAGELLLDVIDRHLTEFDDLQGQLGKMRDGLAGTLRLSIGSDLDAGLPLQAVTDFTRDFSGVSIEIVTADDAHLLSQRAADLAILTNPATDDTVEVLFSQSVRLAALRCGPDNAGDRRLGLWDVMSERLLLPPQSTGTRAAVSHMLRRHRLEPQATTTISAGQLSTMATSEAAIALFPEPVLSGRGLKSPWRRLPIDLPEVQMTVLRGTRAHLTRSAQAFLTVLQTRLDAAADTLTEPQRRTS